MNLRLSREGILLGPVLLLAGLFLAAGRRSERFLPGGEVTRLERTTRQMEQQREVILDRMEHKRLIARKLVAGELTLLQAASRYRELNELDPRFYWDGFRACFPGDSDEERHCREAIDRAEGELEAIDPCLALAQRARLLGELREWKARPGRK